MMVCNDCNAVMIRIEFEIDGRVYYFHFCETCERATQVTRIYENWG